MTLSQLEGLSFISNRQRGGGDVRREWFWVHEMDTVAKDSDSFRTLVGLVQGALANNSTRDAFSFLAELWNAGFCGISFIVGTASLFVAGIVATDLAPATLALLSSDARLCKLETATQLVPTVARDQNMAGSVKIYSDLFAVLAAVRLVLDCVDRSGCGGGARLGWGDGD
jgi:hypothetical protein